jgi:hypothetical protein
LKADPIDPHKITIQLTFPSPHFHLLFVFPISPYLQIKRFSKSEPMRRRTLLKQLMMVSAGMSLVPACLEDRAKASFLYKNLQVGADEEAMLAELAETIIPKTSTPGAKDISAHLFVLKMVDDCRSAEEQKKFMDGLRAFDAAAEKSGGRHFSKMSKEEKQAFLQTLEAGKEGDGPEISFYQSVKKLTIQAYTSSEFFLTKVQVYELVPGRYHGCVPVKAA